MRMLTHGRAFVASLLILFASLPPAAVQAAPADDVRATVARFVDALNTGDLPGALALCGGATVVDQLPPYLYTGPDGCATWLGGVRTMFLQLGVTAITATVDPPSSIDVGNATAYLVTHMKLAVTMKGESSVKDATVTFVLARGAGGWKITHMTWARTGFAT